MQPQLESFRDAGNPRVAHLVFDPLARRGAIINATLDDSVWGGTVFVDRILSSCDRRKIVIDWALETDVIPMEMSVCPYLRRQIQVLTATGRSGISEPSSRYDHLFVHREQFSIGGLTAAALLRPGSVTTTFQVENILVIGRLHSGADYTVRKAVHR